MDFANINDTMRTAKDQTNASSPLRSELFAHGFLYFRRANTPTCGP